MVFLVLDEAVPNRALRKGIVIDFRGGLFVSRGAARNVAGLARCEKVVKMRKNRERMKGGGARCGEVGGLYLQDVELELRESTKYNGSGMSKAPTV